ncbi:MAG: hypothetical protein OXJ52_09290 [Oligoflexia bacterium]|nr:hypothetical protein [Oligoflexia bacterium]
MKLYIQLKNNERIELGAIQSLDGYNKFFAFYANSIMLKKISPYIHWSIFFMLDFTKEKEVLELFVDNYKLGKLIYADVHGKSVLKFIPINGYRNTFLMMGPENSVKEADFPKEFPVFINYQTNAGKNFKSLIPDWTCRKERQEFNLDLPHFEPLKL